MQEQVPHGLSIAEMVPHVIPRASAHHVRVYLNGDYVPKNIWHSLRPKLESSSIHIYATPIKGEQSVFLTVRPEPFSTRQIKAAVPQGLTVAHMVLEHIPRVSVRQAHVWINGDYVPQTMWLSVRPKQGTVVNIYVVPGKGGGKNPLTTVLSLAVMMAAPGIGAGIAASMGGWVGSSFVGVGALGGFIGGAVGVIGKLAIGALAPPSKPRANALTANVAEKPTLFISGGRNQAAPLGRIPRALGKHRMMPMLGALPYTETAGADQYIRMLFVWGYGPLNITDLRIGDTPIASFDGVTVETRQGYDADTPLTIFSNDVLQTDLTVTLTAAGGWQTRTTAIDTDEISIDITFLNGLFEFNAAGKKISRTVVVEVEYSVTGLGVWTAVTGFTATAQQNATLRLNTVFSVTQGQYDVRLRRITTDTASDQIYDIATWTAIRSIHSVNPVNLVGMAVTAVRIKATDQLNGIVDRFNGIVESILPDWDSGTAAWVTRATSNPASIFRAILQGRENARALPNARIDLTGLQTWHGECVTAGREFNYIVDTDGRTIQSMLQDVAAAGRGAPTLIDGKWGVVRDKLQTVPVQHFTPRNSFGFSGAKAFDDLPHALKVRFINRDKDWQPDERIVYDDGYDINTATKFEGLDLIGVTDPDHIWKDGRYHIATARLRPEIYTFSADIEHIVCTRGDLIRFSHDVTLHGLGSARIKALVFAELLDDDGFALLDDDGNALTDDNTVAALTLDDTMVMEALKSYNIRVRLSTGASLLLPVNTVAGSTKTLVLTTPLALASAPAIGDLAMFGEVGSESVELIVKSIEPMSDLSARLICVDAAPAVHTADTGAIPAYSSQITIPPDLRRPPAPVIAKVQSANDALVISTGGNYVPSIIITLGAPDYPLRLTPIVFVKTTDETVYRTAATSESDHKISILDVTAGSSYDVSIYYKNAAGLHSASTVQSAIAVTGGVGNPSDVTGFSAQQNGGAVVFKWTASTDYALKGYDILYGQQSGTIAGALFLTEAAKGTEMTNASVPPGAWKFYIQARDFADQVSAIAASFNLTVTNQNTEVFLDEYDPDFIGNTAESVGFYTHWTGKLIPEDQHLASYYGWEVFDEFVPTPVALCKFTGTDKDAGFSSELRVWNNINAQLGIGQTGTPAVNFKLAHADAPFGGVYTFEDFVIGSITARYFAGQIYYVPVAGSVAYIDLFTMTGDSKIETYPVNGFAVGSGGTTLTFADYGLSFHVAPNVQVTASSAGATSGVALTPTTTGCEIHLYNGTGGVAGTANATITGV